MRYDREPRVKILDPIDVELASDADLNETWQKRRGEGKSPRERITIKEALIAQSRLIEPEDSPPISNN